MKNTVVLTMNVLAHLLSKDEIVSAFPFMRYAKRTWDSRSTSGGCGNCGKKRPTRQTKQHILETVKAHLTGMRPEQKTEFKRLAGVDELTIHFTGPNNMSKTIYV